jgi:nucleoside-diphosphate-sugar epimerase
VLAGTSELRTNGTDALLSAAREAGVRRFIAQSAAAFSRYAREGGPVKSEDDPRSASMACRAGSRRGGASGACACDA